MRDLAGIRGVGLPVWCNGIAAPPSVAGLTFVGWQEPIGCGGVAVFPDDVIVADEDGAVVIPAALLDEVLAAGPEQERYEAWIMGEVERGMPLPGLYPPNAETKARYEAFRAQQVERYPGRHRDVEALHARVDLEPGQVIALLGHQPAQALALAAEHQDDARRQVERLQRCRARRVQADDPVAALLKLGQGAAEIDHLH